MGGRCYEACLLPSIFLQRAEKLSHKEPEKNTQEKDSGSIRTGKLPALCGELFFLRLKRLENDDA